VWRFKCIGCDDTDSWVNLKEILFELSISSEAEKGFRESIIINFTKNISDYERSVKRKKSIFNSG
jgi:hypothetical protein